MRYHTNKGTAADKITRDLLDGWFKREKPKKEKASTSTISTTASTANKPAANSETAFMRDMPRVYQLTAEQKAHEAAGWYYEVPGLDEATKWFYASQNIDRDDPAFEDEFDRVFELAVKNGDVMVVDSAQGECQVGVNRQPVMIQKEVPQYNKGKSKDRVVCMLHEIFIDERKITRSEIAKIRTMGAKTENQAVEFLKELLPDVETNWAVVLDEDWLFEKDADGLFVGKVTA